MKRILKIAVITLLSFKYLNAQNNDIRAITTGVPFLLIAGDARSAGLADMGVATSTDAFSQAYNPSKYAFAKRKHGFALSYTPYLTSIANDISLGQLNYYNKYNDRSAFAFGFRYFGLGEIQLTNETGNPLGSVNPNEFAIDGSYSLKLSETYAMGVAGRFIRSNLKIPNLNNDASAATSFAVDISGLYESKEIAFEKFNGKYRLGYNIQNIGPKISYDQDVKNSSNFLPTNLRLGGSFDFILDDFNKVSAIAETTKLLVPTPQVAIDANGNGFIDNGESQTAAQEYNATGWTEGIFKSFGDAPDGFGEELKEFTWALGAEYMYQDSFAFRAGYFNEHETKGARKYFTLGAGFKYQIVKVDVSYLFSASKVRNPLENTLRFSLTFNFGDEYQQM